MPAGRTAAIESPERKKRIERLRIERPGITMEQLGQELGVASKTIQRDMAEMRAENKLLKKEIPREQYTRDAMFERITDTYESITWAIGQCREMVTILRKEIEENGKHRCKECGRGGSDPLKWQSFFKGVEAFERLVRNLEERLGEISNTPQLSIYQIEADLQTVLLALARVDEQAARQLYADLIAQSTRRAQRLPEYSQLIEGAALPVLPAPVKGEAGLRSAP